MTIIISKSELAKLNQYLANNPSKEGIEIEFEACEDTKCSNCESTTEADTMAKEGEELLKYFN